MSVRLEGSQGAQEKGRRTRIAASTTFSSSCVFFPSFGSTGRDTQLANTGLERPSSAFPSRSTDFVDLQSSLTEPGKAKAAASRREMDDGNSVFSQEAADDQQHASSASWMNYSAPAQSPSYQHPLLDTFQQHLALQQPPQAPSSAVLPSGPLLTSQGTLPGTLPLPHPDRSVRAFQHSASLRPVMPALPSGPPADSSAAQEYWRPPPSRRRDIYMEGPTASRYDESDAAFSARRGMGLGPGARSVPVQQPHTAAHRAVERYASVGTMPDAPPAYFGAVNLPFSNSPANAPGRPDNHPMTHSISDPAFPAHQPQRGISAGSHGALGHWHTPATTDRPTMMPRSNLHGLSFREMMLATHRPQAPDRQQASTRHRRSAAPRQLNSDPARSQDDTNNQYASTNSSAQVPRPARRVVPFDPQDVTLNRHLQMLRGAIQGKLVATKAALQSLESVDVAELPESELTCVICYNDYGTESPEGINEAPLRIPKCRHVFGDHCIKKWLEDSDSCPYCRGKLQSEQKHTLPPSTSYYNLMRLRGLPLPSGMSEEAWARLATQRLSETEISELFFRGGSTRVAAPRRRPPPDQGEGHETRRIRQRRSGPSSTDAHHNRSSEETATLPVHVSQGPLLPFFGFDGAVVYGAPRPTAMHATSDVVAETDTQRPQSQADGVSEDTARPGPTSHHQDSLGFDTSLSPTQIRLEPQILDQSAFDTMFEVDEADNSPSPALAVGLSAMQGTTEMPQSARAEDFSQRPDEAESVFGRPSRSRPW